MAQIEYKLTHDKTIRFNLSDTAPHIAAVYIEPGELINITTNDIEAFTNDLKAVFEKYEVLKPMVENENQILNVCKHTFIQKDSYWQSCKHCGMLQTLFCYNDF